MYMKLWIVILSFSILLGGCANTVPQSTTTTTESAYTEPTIQTTMPTTEVTAPTETTIPPTTVETLPAHSPLYSANYTAEEIKMYFDEVVLSMEYSDGTGDTTLVQKWFNPIYYYILGTPTQEDISVLSNLFNQLNEIPGFPGIYPATDEAAANLTLSFLDNDALQEGFSEVVNGEYVFGATQFWYYTATNELYTARVGYRTDIDQQTRNSILLEEVINSVGISDTVLRTDSIVYQYSNENTSLSDVDWIILKLLYDPAMQAGMNASACADVIAKLYY